MRLKPVRTQGRWGFVPLLLALVLACPGRVMPAEDIPFEWTGVERVVAVADLHGDFDRFVFILAHPQVHLIDEDLHWAGGKAHLVQLGDVLDRGPRAKDILDLLMRLEREAADAGGAVHMLLGNHEEMNITGIALDYPGYVTVEQFVAFLPEDFRRQRDEDYLKTLPAEDRKKAELEGLNIFVDDGYRAFWKSVRDSRDSRAERAYVLGFNQKYGDWLVRQNAVIKINGVVYVHGGISEEISQWPIRDINQTLRDELEFFQGRMRSPQQFSRPFHPKLVYDPGSPLWYRGLATKSEKTAESEVDRILANLDAKAIVVGHNFQSYNGGTSQILDRRNVARFHDRVWVMDTGISSSSYAGLPSALIYENGEFKPWGESEEVAKQSGVRPPPPTPLTPQEMEIFLRTAEITGRGPGPGGRTDAWKLTLTAADVSRPALFRYIDRRRPDPLADSYKYDLAAYVLSKYLGLTVVPPIVERQVENIPGALQAFVPRARSIVDLREAHVRPPDPATLDHELADLQVFQALVFDDCRNEKDTLVGGDDGRVYRVDFSEAFAPNTGDAPGCTVTRCSKLLFRRLLAWEDKTVSGYLGRYLDAGEIAALNTRRSLVVRRIRMLIKREGEARVLF